jgi:hypothetical protein
MGADGADSRLWAGIHWRFDNDAGIAMGQQVAALALGSRAFAMVPEPASWAMLILGFGIVGAGPRARRAGPATTGG